MTPISEAYEPHDQFVLPELVGRRLLAMSGDKRRNLLRKTLAFQEIWRPVDDDERAQLLDAAYRGDLSITEFVGSVEKPNRAQARGMWVCDWLSAAQPTPGLGALDPPSDALRLVVPALSEVLAARVTNPSEGRWSDDVAPPGVSSPSTTARLAREMKAVAVTAGAAALFLERPADPFA